MIQEFETFDQAWTETLSHLLCAPRTTSRVGGTRELVGYAFKLTDLRHNVLLNERRLISPPYAAAELLWYLSREAKIDRVVAYAPQYRKFAEDSGYAYGAYGRRIANGMRDRLQHDQLDSVLDILKKAPDTRQAVVQLWSPDDLWHALYEPMRDIPCTVCWQFKLLDEKLHMLAYMRSNDVWLGTPYDVFCFTSVQQLVAGELGVEAGTYTHVVGSMHLYDKNVDAATEAESLDVPRVEWSGYKFPQNMRSLDYVLKCEESYRTNCNVESKITFPCGNDILLNDLLACIQMFHHDVGAHVHVYQSPLFHALKGWHANR